MPLYSDPPRVETVTDGELDAPVVELDAPVVLSDARGTRDRALDRLAGTLVHRLFQLGWQTLPDEAQAARHMARLARPEELVDVPDAGQFFAGAARAFLTLSGRSDVRAWLASGQPHYEVPFSFIAPGRQDVVVRGAIDCLVARPEGGFQVLEFKTGAPRPEHAHQLDTYLAAVRHAFPGAAVTGELVYPEPGD